MRVRHLLAHAGSIRTVRSARDALSRHPTNEQGETSLAVLRACDDQGKAGERGLGFDLPLCEWSGCPESDPYV
jgi:hypothetical protein